VCHQSPIVVILALIMTGLAGVVSPLFAESPPDYFLTCDPDSFAAIYDHWWLDHEIPCTVTAEGQTWPECRLRIRGDSSRQYPKKSLKIKSDGDDFVGGNDVLNFNADWLDRSYLRTVLATRLFERAGVPCFTAAHARLHLNGHFLGLYIRVQNMDEDFLTAQGLDPAGNLYKATRDGASLTPEENVHALWEKKTNEGESWDDLEALIADLAAVSDAEFAGWADTALAVDEVISALACNTLLGNGSTYYHNYYMFHDVGGAWSIFPWDLDKTFAAYGSIYPYHRTSSSVLRDNPLPEHVFVNPETFDAYHTRVDELLATTFNTDFYDPLIDSLRASIEPSVAVDYSDDVSSTSAWSLYVGQERSIGILSRTNSIRDQLDHAPRVCRLDRMGQSVQDSVTLTWHPARDPDGEAVTYSLRYSRDIQFPAENTVSHTGLVDTVFTLPLIPADGEYFWQIDATDGGGGHATQGTDSYNQFTVARGTVLVPEITADTVLTAADSPYFVDRGLLVAEGALLTIEAGTELRIAAGNSIIVAGRLQANGTDTDPILFTRDLENEAWGAICFHDADGPSSLSGVTIRGASRDGVDPLRQAAISSWRTDLELDHVTFDQCEQSVYAVEASLTVRHCQFLPTNTAETLKVQIGTVTIEFCSFWQTASVADAVDLDVIDNGIIRECHFHGLGHGDDLIDLGSACTDFQIIDNVLSGASDKGVSVGETSTVTLTGNVIIDCGVGVAIKEGSTGILDHNTFHGNEVALQVREKTAGWGGSHAEVVNTILASSTEAETEVDDLSTLVVSYSLSDSETLPGQGNLLADPRFVAPLTGDFRLQFDSPCIDTGAPESPDDPDGTRTDMGALPFDQAIRSVVINEINYNSAEDFDPGDWVELHNPSLVAVDLSGLRFRDEGHVFVIPDGTGIEAGGYLVLVENLTGFQTLFPGVGGVVGDLGFGFSGGGEPLSLVAADGEVYDHVTYDDDPPWPPEPDGLGPSLELIDPAYDNDQSYAWAASSNHGTPGTTNSAVVSVPGTQDPPTVTGLAGVHPNPFNPRCAVAYALSQAGHVDLGIHDLRGRRVVTLVGGARPAGRHQVVWTGCDGRGRAVASGVYVVRLQAGGKTETAKVLLVR